MLAQVCHNIYLFSAACVEQGRFYDFGGIKDGFVYIYAALHQLLDSLQVALKSAGTEFPAHPDYLQPKRRFKLVKGKRMNLMGREHMGVRILTKTKSARDSGLKAKLVKHLFETN
jgi:hypothetical protein